MTLALSKVVTIPEMSSGLPPRSAFITLTMASFCDSLFGGVRTLNSATILPGRWPRRMPYASLVPVLNHSSADLEIRTVQCSEVCDNWKTHPAGVLKLWVQKWYRHFSDGRSNSIGTYATVGSRRPYWRTNWTWTRVESRRRRDRLIKFCCHRRRYNCRISIGRVFWQIDRRRVVTSSIWFAYAHIWSINRCSWQVNMARMTPISCEK